MSDHYVDTNGNYLGAFEGCVPEDGIKVDTHPDHGWQKYDLVNNEWLPLTAEQESELASLNN